MRNLLLALLTIFSAAACKPQDLNLDVPADSSATARQGDAPQQGEDPVDDENPADPSDPSANPSDPADPVADLTDPANHDLTFAGMYLARSVGGSIQNGQNKDFVGLTMSMHLDVDASGNGSLYWYRLVGTCSVLLIWDLQAWATTGDAEQVGTACTSPNYTWVNSSGAQSSYILFPDVGYEGSVARVERGTGAFDGQLRTTVKLVFHNNASHEFFFDLR